MKTDESLANPQKPQTSKNSYKESINHMPKKPRHKIPNYKPYFPKTALKYVKNTIRSGWISSTAGEYLDKCEEELKRILGVKYVILVSSGTAAMHLIARIMRKTYPENYNVVGPNNCYMSAWNAWLYDQSQHPITLTSIEPDLQTWNMDINQITSSLNNIIMMIVHTHGNIINVPKIKRDHPDLIIIEDNCEGLFGKYEQIYSGTVSQASAISFFGNKTITSGEGGAILTNDPNVNDEARLLKNQGQSKIRYHHDVLGYNYRFTNLQAAILFSQLEEINQIMKKKTEIYQTYKEMMLNIKDVWPQYVPPETTHGKWTFGIRFINDPGYQQKEEYYRNEQIEIRSMFPPINAHGYAKQITSINGYEYAKKLYDECIILPSYPDLTLREIEWIIYITKKYKERSCRPH